MKIGFSSVLTIVGLCGLTACSQPPAPADQVVVERQVIHDAPPPPRREVTVAPPGPPERYAWDAGHWNSDGHQYRWQGGSWIPRQAPNRTWVPAHWVKAPNGWTQVPGAWR